MKYKLYPTSMVIALQLTICGSALSANINPERRGIGIDPNFTTFIPGSAAEGAGDDLDPLRSLVVTTEKSMQQISFKDVMNRLAKAGNGVITGEELFRRWWDTNNETANAEFTDDIWHCDGKNTPSNDFTYACPRPEGAEAKNGALDKYITIGATNRLDLAPADGKNCGEQRLVFARNSGQSGATNRNLLIFEAHMPNPDPGSGVFGCRPIAEFWASLSSETFIDDDGNQKLLTPEIRGRKLRDFFFDGIPSKSVVAPVATARYGANSDKKGQIRTNQFAIDLNPGFDFIWTLREYKTNLKLSKLRIIPATVKGTPATELFATSINGEKVKQASELGDDILSQLTELSKSNLNNIGFGTSNNALNMGESDETKPENGDVSFGFSNSGADGVIRKKLNDATIPNGLSEENIVARIGAMTCAGCHEYSTNASMGNGLNWPAKTMNFTHIAESPMNESPNQDGLRFPISLAMHDPDNPKAGFLAPRMGVLLNILNSETD